MLVFCRAGQGMGVWHSVLCRSSSPDVLPLQYAQTLPNACVVVVHGLRQLPGAACQGSNAMTLMLGLPVCWDVCCQSACCKSRFGARPLCCVRSHRARRQYLCLHVDWHSIARALRSGSWSGVKTCK
jgi:hypothetical protein